MGDSLCYDLRIQLRYQTAFSNLHYYYSSGRAASQPALEAHICPAAN